MQGDRPKFGIKLSEKERSDLERIVRQRKAEFRLVQRAQIILLASKGMYRNTEIGIKVGCSRNTVRYWRKCFLESRLDGLKDKPRSGKPPTFTAQERAQVLALATRDPQSEGKHFTEWSLRELADHASEKGIVSSISWSTVRRWLQDADIKPHKWEYWLNSPDPDFKKR